MYSKPFRVGGNSFRDNVLYPGELSAPDALPKGLNPATLAEPSRELNRALNIQGYTNPNALDSIQLLNTSCWTLCQIQVSARFTF